MKCPICGNEYTPQQQKENSPNKITVKHEVDGRIISSLVIPYDDAFFEIVEGKYKGNLVHRWNVIEPKNLFI